MPAISVIIPTFNRAHFVGDAIRSILHQTFPDFELLVVDDGSTDGTADLVRAIKDVRVKLISHDRNRGIPAARNTGLDHARGHFIAWLDSDDVSRPTRLEEQLHYLYRHPKIEMIGACAGKITPEGAHRTGIRVPPLTPEAVSAWLLFRSAFQQSSIMGRATTLKSFRYREEFPVCEDLDVFIRIASVHRSLNLPRILIDRRIHEGQSIRTHSEAVSDRSVALLAKPLMDLGIRPSRSDLKGHIALGKPWPSAEPYDADHVQWAEDWMLRLHTANKRSRHLDHHALALATGFFWLLTCKAASASIGAGKAASLAARSPLSRGLLGPAARSWLATAAQLKAGLR
jgi:glycosyltransferase involved in cell wall biosynthesis